MTEVILIFSLTLNAFFFSNKALIYLSQLNSNCIWLINISAARVQQEQADFFFFLTKWYGSSGPPQSKGESYLLTEVIGSNWV